MKFALRLNTACCNFSFKIINDHFISNARFRVCPMQLLSAFGFSLSYKMFPSAGGALMGQMTVLCRLPCLCLFRHHPFTTRVPCVSCRGHFERTPFLVLHSMSAANLYTPLEAVMTAKLQPATDASLYRSLIATAAHLS